MQINVMKLEEPHSYTLNTKRVWMCTVHAPCTLTHKKFSLHNTQTLIFLQHVALMPLSFTLLLTGKVHHTFCNFTHNPQSQWGGCEGGLRDKVVFTLRPSVFFSQAGSLFIRYNAEHLWAWGIWKGSCPFNLIPFKTHAKKCNWLLNKQKCSLWPKFQGYCRSMKMSDYYLSLCCSDDFHLWI